jgi:putative transposase
MTDNIARKSYRISDALWEQIKPLLPPKLPQKGGRPRMDNRKAMEAIFYVFHTGCGWKALPRSMGAKSTVHARFQKWRKAGLFQRMWLEGLLSYDEMKAFVWHGKRVSRK